MHNSAEIQRCVVDASQSGPHLLITGGVHGDEYEPMAAIRRLIATFRRAAGESVLVRGQLTLVPVVNRSAFLRGERTAEDGLDLARVCPGRPDGSITERTAAQLSTLIRSADFYIDLHTGGTDYTVVPMTGYMLHPEGGVLERQRQMARVFNLPVIWGTSPLLDGRSLSVARDADVPAIYAEHGGARTCGGRGVEAYVDGCLNVMAMLGMIDRSLPPSRVEHVVEDSRPGSGHMQVCNPSPITGFFEPAVVPGDWIDAGQVIGTVTDWLGNDLREVRCREDGMVLTLRTCPRVREGESLAVILDAANSDAAWKL